MKPQKGLGRGLGAIFNNDKIEPKITPMSSNDTSLIALNKITPNLTQPRRAFDEDLLEELANSIKELGIIQPITLRDSGNGTYLIISGERRWRAAQRANLEYIPAYVREVDDVQLHAMALVENLQRADLNPIEIALSLQRFVDECGYTQEALAKKVSMKRSSISNYLRLLKLSDDVQYALKSGLITMGHAKALAAIEDLALQGDILSRCIEESLSVRDVESIASKIALGTYQSTESDSSENNDDTNIANTDGETSIVAEYQRESYDKISERLSPIFKRGVQIKSNNKGGGKIVINFSDSDELQKLIEELER